MYVDGGAKDFPPTQLKPSTCGHLNRDLTMRLSDAGLRQRQTKTLYPNHRPPPWLIEDAPRDRSNRLLADGPRPPIARATRAMSVRHYKENITKYRVHN